MKGTFLLFESLCKYQEKSGEKSELLEVVNNYLLTDLKDQLNMINLTLMMLAYNKIKNTNVG